MKKEFISNENLGVIEISLSKDYYIISEVQDGLMTRWTATHFVAFPKGIEGEFTKL